MPTDVDAPPDEAWLGLPDGAIRWLDGTCRIERSRTTRLCSTRPRSRRHHAVIEGQAGDYRLSDRRSSNGTYLNGVPITAPCTCRTGTEVAFGQVAAQVQVRTGPVGPRSRGDTRRRHPADR
jgi:pSer/pThr/pTyr-binding forkhead associated (FHA) protein